MPLETATYISDLVTSNPAASDGLNNADDHMRLIKGALKTTFPNITGALTASHTSLDAAVTATSNGVAVLSDAGVFFKTNSTDGITNTAAGKINLKLAGQLAAEFTYASSVNTLAWHGPATFDAAITAPGIVPIGSMIMWLTDTLPTLGTWCWANGGVLSRTGAGAALFALWGTKYGVGDGSTTFNVINMQEVVPVGKSTMGGAASPSLLASIAVGIKTVLGSIFGTDTHALTTAQLASHRHGATIYDPGHAHGGTMWSTGIQTGYQGGGTWSGWYNFQPAGMAAAVTGTRVRSNDSTLDATDLVGSGTAHPNTQPSMPVNFIIRIG